MNTLTEPTIRAQLAAADWLTLCRDAGLVRDGAWPDLWDVTLNHRIQHLVLHPSHAWPRSKWPDLCDRLARATNSADHDPPLDLGRGLLGITLYRTDDPTDDDPDPDHHDDTPVGRTPRGPARWDTTYAPHQWVAGQTKSGKTAYLCHLAARQTDAWDYVLVDPKSTEMGQLLPGGRVLDVGVGIDGARRVLRLVAEHIDTRQNWMRSNGFRSVEDPACTLRRLLVIADECPAPVLGATGESRSDVNALGHEWTRNLTHVLSQGRAAGVYLVGAAHRLDVDFLSGLARAQARARTVLGPTDATALEMAFGPGHADLQWRPVRLGTAWVKDAAATTTGPVRVTFPYVSLHALADRLGTRLYTDTLTPEQRDDVAAIPAWPSDHPANGAADATIRLPGVGTTPRESTVRSAKHADASLRLFGMGV